MTKGRPRDETRCGCCNLTFPSYQTSTRDRTQASHLIQTRTTSVAVNRAYLPASRPRPIFKPCAHAELVRYTPPQVEAPSVTQAGGLHPLLLKAEGQQVALSYSPVGAKSGLQRCSIDLPAGKCGMTPWHTGGAQDALTRPSSKVQLCTFLADQ